jgi:mycofactocin system glycosyltransferase
MSLVDVVIPFHGDPVHLATILDALTGFHVTVVNDASRHGAALDALATNDVRVLHLTSNGGPAGARNAGLAATSRPYVWFIDDDVLLRDGHALWRALSPTLSHPDVGAVAPRVRGPIGENARSTFEHAHSPLDMGPLSALVAPFSRVSYLPSACLVVRRDAVAAGFDPALRVGEDVDLVWRMVDEGWLVRYDATVIVEHPTRPTWASWWRQRHDYGRSAADLSLRHGDRVTPLRVDQWTAVAWVAFLAGQGWISARILQRASAHIAEIAHDADDPAQVGRDVIRRGLIGSGGPLARSLVRNYAWLLLALLGLRRTRRHAATVIVAGLWWRLKDARPRGRDVALALLDDLAYGTGLLRGAWHHRHWRVVVPDITRPTMGWREMLGR